MSESGSYAAQQIKLTLACNEFLSPVLRRIAGMLAAQARLPSNRVSDVVMVASALADIACEEIAGERITVQIDVEAGSVALAVGPLDAAVSEVLRSHIGDGDPIVLAAASSFDVLAGRDDDTSHLRIAFAA